MYALIGTKGVGMLQKITIGLFALSAMLVAGNVQLQGVNTVEEMYVGIATKSEAYINHLYSEESKAEVEVLLDLYWAMECKNDVVALETFASHYSDKELSSLKAFHLSNEESYRDNMNALHTVKCS